MLEKSKLMLLRKLQVAIIEACKHQRKRLIMGISTSKFHHENIIVRNESNAHKSLIILVFNRNNTDDGLK